MRRLLIAGLALLVLGAAAGASNTGPRAHAAGVPALAPAPVPATARVPNTIAPPTGSTCFVAAGRGCSLTPCVEFIHDATSGLVQPVTVAVASAVRAAPAVHVAPAVRAAPRAQCPRPGLSLGSSVIRRFSPHGAGQTPGFAAGALGLSAQLRALGHQLRARPPRRVK